MVEKEERLQSHIPYPELYAPEAVDLELTRTILGAQEANLSRVASSRAGAPITSIDLRRTPRRLKDDEVLNTISTHLGVEKDIFDINFDNGAGKTERDKVFHNINVALEEAEHYLTNVLGLRVPEFRTQKTWITGPRDIIELVRKTSRYSETDRKGLQAHAAYCALVSVAIAVFELQKKEAHSLASEMKYVEDIFTQPIEKNAMEPLFYKYFAVSDPGPISAVVSGLKSQCRVRFSMRDKSPESQITKYLMKPEASAEAALKDAMGLRIEVEKKERIEDVLARTLNYIQKHFGASDITVEDRNLLGPKRLEDFRKRKFKEIEKGDKIPVLTDTSPLTADSFRAIKITAKIKILRDAASVIERPLEIQFVEPENKNESGLASHAVYELKKHITVMTRLFGGCSEKWLKQHAMQIAKTEGYSDQFVNNTIQGLKKTGFLMEMPDVPNKKVYAAVDVYRRWLRVDGLITDPKIRRSVLHKLGATNG